MTRNTTRSIAYRGAVVAIVVLLVTSSLGVGVMASPASSASPAPQSNTEDVEGQSVQLTTESSITASTTLQYLDNVSDPALSDANSIDMAGDYAYTSGRSNSDFAVADISDPNNPVVVGSLQRDYASSAGVVKIPGEQYVYVGTDSGTEIIDVSDPASPTKVGETRRHQWFASTTDGHVIASQSDATGAGNNLTVYNVSSPESPEKIGEYSNTNVLNDIEALHAEGDWLYATARDSDEMAIIDISTRSSATLESNVTFTSTTDPLPLGIHYQDDHVYVPRMNNATLDTYDVSDRTNPTKVDSINTTETDPAQTTGAGSELYVRDASTEALTVFNASMPSAPAEAATDSGPVRNIAVSDLGQYVVATDNTNGELKTYDTGTTQTGEEVSGTAVDQHGNPVPENTTVEFWGVAETAVDGSTAEELNQSAEDLFDELENPLPESWNEDYDLDAHQDGQYLLVHDASDWERNGNIQTVIDTQLDAPKLETSTGEAVVLSIWDASDDQGLCGNPVANSFPGTPQSGTIVVEQLSPSGEVTDRQELETETIAETDTCVTTNEHEGAITHLPAGAYRAYPKGDESAGYTFTVGDANELSNRLEQDLRDEAETKIDRARRISNLSDQRDLVRKTVTTDENGSFSTEVQSGTVTVQIQAYRADGQILRNTQNASMQDLREASQNGYNGTFILPSPEPERVSPPASDVTVRTVRSPEVPNLNMSSYAGLLQWYKNLRMNETLADMESRFEQRLDNQSRAQLEEFYNQTKGVVETHPPAREYVLNETSYDELPSAGDLSDAELRDMIRTMQTALYQADRVEMGQPDLSAGSEAISGQFPVPDGTTEDDVAVRIVWSNGTVEPMPTDYWSVDDGGVLSDAAVSIEDYPISSNDAAVANIRVQVANENGVGEQQQAVTNPAFDGAVPRVNAIDLSTLRPGTGEPVSFNFRAEDGTGYGSVQSVDVFGPDGTLVDSTINSTTDRVRFTPTSQGDHFVRVEYSNQGGTNFVESFSVRAEESSSSQPPTIRASDGATGTHALVGEGFRSAQVSVEGDRIEMAGVIPGGEDAPGAIVAEPQSAMRSDISEVEVRVLRGDDRETVRSHMAVEIHTETLEDDTLLWNNGNAFKHDGSVQYGEVRDEGEDKDVIVVQTNAEGVATVEMNRDPNAVQRINHWRDYTLPSVSPLTLLDTVLDVLGNIPALVGDLTTSLTHSARTAPTASTTTPTTAVAA